MSVAAKKKKIFDGRYEILSIVGRGACSVVYHARHAMTQSSEVALKVLLSQKGGGSNTERLRKEALAMVSSRHKYVVRLDDFHSVKDLCYLAMEYAPEGDLRKYVQKTGGKLAMQTAEVFFLQTAEALGFVHRVGITHRDIKPDNILVMNDRAIRLADFGVAVLPGELASLEELRAGVGTMSYMAPEVLEGKACDKLSDIYSLGVSFYEMLSGVHPFEKAPLIKQLEVRQDGSIKHIKSLVPDISPKLAEVIMTCMRSDPGSRFPSINDLLLAFDSGSVKPAGGESAAGPARTPASQQTPSNKRARAEKALSSKSPPSGGSDAQNEKRPSGAKASFERAKQQRSRQEASLSKPDKTPPHSVPITPPPVEAAPPIEPPVENIPPAVSGTEASKTEADDGLDVIVGEDLEPLSNQHQAEEEIYGDDNYQLQPEPAFAEEDDDYAPVTASAPRRTPLQTRGTSKAPLAKILLLVLGVMAANLILKSFLGIDVLGLFRGSSPSIESDAGPRIIPLVQAPITQFPVLPDGIFVGSATNIVPGREVPLTIISTGTSQTLTFLLGVNGWSPIPVSYSDETARQKRGLKSDEIQVISNGFVLNFKGRAVEGSLRGTFKNLITGDEGTWMAHPLSEQGEE
ncbi:MAG: protein kinase [Deltaproteobacteria bacterium]|nr:protein kinase [Deltaproteobacteria bacterium]